MIIIPDKEKLRARGQEKMRLWRSNWPMFAHDILGSRLDTEQEDILYSIQTEKRVSVVSGTARGKDFVAANAGMCFLYLTPKWNERNELIENTKVALTAPTDRQVKDIMMPEISRLYNKAKNRGVVLPGKLLTYGIRTPYEEWFLTGFKADENNHEAWSGFHAVNTMFLVTEASGMNESIFDAIEGNMQGNSRMALFFNFNSPVGYAARSQRSERWVKHRLNSLTAPNVVEKKIVIPGQVDYEWVKDKLELWAIPIEDHERKDELDDFQFEGQWYRPEDLCRIKVLGKAPKVADDVLIPLQWVEVAQQRWQINYSKSATLKLGTDVAGMGRDCTVHCYRYGNYVERFDKHNSGGRADHMAVAGKIRQVLDMNYDSKASIDTIGEGAGVYSRLVELGYEKRIASCKFSKWPEHLSRDKFTDVTGQRQFANHRAYLFWAVRDWLDPKNGNNPMLPPGGTLANEASQIRYRMRSDGKIEIEPKEDIKKRLGHSPDEFESLVNTFYPFPTVSTISEADLERSFE